MSILKNLSLITLSVTLLFTACKKDDNDPVGQQGQLPVVRTAIIAKWMATSETYKEYDNTGKIVDEEAYTYKTDELVVEFASNNTYAIKWDDGETETGKYELKEQVTKYGTTGYYLSIFENNSTTETDFSLVSVSGNTLVLHQFDTDVDDNNKEYLSEITNITFAKQ